MVRAAAWHARASIDSSSLRVRLNTLALSSLQGSAPFADTRTTDCRALAGFIPAFEASHLLSDQEPGTYLVRFSKTKVGAFALTYVDHARAIKHSLIHSNPYPPYGVTIPGM